MAALSRPTRATYVINENVTVDTTDNEDHTFSGIVFPIKCKEILPVNHIVVNTIKIRGDLGPITVWVSKPESTFVSTSTSPSSTGQSNDTQQQRYNLRPNNNNNNNIQNSDVHGRLIMKEKHWIKIYENTHKPSPHEYESLDISQNPIILKPGEVRGIYIHSSIQSDRGIVYDNQQKIKTHDDHFITVLPGRAHVATEPFSTVPIWGPGNPWRDHREFVGKICYGVVYDLWNPTENLRFGNSFRNLALTLFACQRRMESPLSSLPDDCIFYILNMCRWDWVNDSYESVRDHKRKEREKRRLLLLEMMMNNGNNDNNNDNDGSDGGVVDTVVEEKEEEMGSNCDNVGVAVGHGNSATAATVSVANTSSDNGNTCTSTCKQKKQKVEDDDLLHIDDNDNNDDEGKSGDHNGNDNDDDNDDNDSEYDEDYHSESDQDEESTSSNESRLDEWGRPIGSFRYIIYDDYESTQIQEERENQRLREERDARRRWMESWHNFQNNHVVNVYGGPAAAAFVFMGNIFPHSDDDDDDYSHDDDDDDDNGESESSAGEE